MTFTDSIKTCFNKYADFSGRASRSEYWWWSLFVMLAFMAAILLVAVLGETLGMIVFAIVVLGTLIPSISCTVRRLHDTNKSGWMALLGLIPFVGGLIMLYFSILESDEGDNDFGAPST